MKKTVFILMICASLLGVTACQKNKPQTMWAPDVDTTLNVPPVNTGGTSKTAPYANCNYGEDCSRGAKKAAPAAPAAPTGGNGSRSISVTATDEDGVTRTRTMTITPDENGGGSIVFSGDDMD